MMTQWKTTSKVKSTLLVVLLLGRQILDCHANLVSARQLRCDDISRGAGTLEKCAESVLSGLACGGLLLRFLKYMAQVNIKRKKVRNVALCAGARTHAAQPRRLQGIELGDASPLMLGKKHPVSIKAPSNRKPFAFYSALVMSFLFVVYGTLSLFAELIVAAIDGNLGRQSQHLKVGNPLYHHTMAWREDRHLFLLGLTRQDADFFRRMIASVVAGGLIGIERRAPNRAVGVRTMVLVSLGACIFTIASMFAFEGGTQEWDSSRVAAALPSGVGFLGAAVIFKVGSDLLGLTTASSIWLSCAVGLCCGGARYFIGFFGVASMVAVLRFGPRSKGSEGESDTEELTEVESSSWNLPG